jgi:PEP-CTERM motif
MMIAIRRLALVSSAVAALTFGLTTAAHAVSIGLGSSFTWVFPAPAANPHLAADATIMLFSLTSTTAVLDILVHNTSSGDTGFTDRLTALGFRVTPTPTASSSLAVTFVSGTDAFQHADTPDAIPSFSGLQNVCAYVGNNCNAGNAGLTAGQTDEFRLTLSGAFSGLTALDISNIGIKFTDCTGCSFEIAGVPRTSVPEPSTLLLLGTAVSGIAFVARRSRRK